MACNHADQLVATSNEGRIVCFDVSNEDWPVLWRRQLLGCIPRSVSFDPTGTTVSIFALETGDM